MYNININKSLALVITLLIGGVALFNQNNAVNVLGKPEEPTSTYVVKFDSTGSTYDVNWYGTILPQMQKMGNSFSSKRLSFFTTVMTNTPTSGSYTFPVSRFLGNLGQESAINNGYNSSPTEPSLPGPIPNIQYVKVDFTGTAPTLKGAFAFPWGQDSTLISNVAFPASSLRDSNGIYFTTMDKFQITFPNWDSTTIIYSVEVGYNC